MQEFCREFLWNEQRTKGREVAYCEYHECYLEPSDIKKKQCNWKECIYLKELKRFNELNKKKARRDERLKNGKNIRGVRKNKVKRKTKNKSIYDEYLYTDRN
jgi:hypothetical protein